MAGRKKAGTAQGMAEDLAEFLRQLRVRSDGGTVSYAEMADRLGGRRYCSAVTLSRADQGGDRLPRAETVTGYVMACGGALVHLQHARRLLAIAQRRRQRARTAALFKDPRQGAKVAVQRHPATARHPDYMRTPLDFQQGLRGYRREVGGPSVRTIAENARTGGKHITKSSVQRMVTHGMFPGWQQVEAFLVGCRPEKLPDLEPWHRAWRRVFGPTTAQSQYPVAVESFSQDLISLLMSDGSTRWNARQHHLVRAILAQQQAEHMATKPTGELWELFRKHSIAGRREEGRPGHPGVVDR
ncbi:hypothetical protein ACFVZ3_10100 [Kitasatospora purpeofusca]|uniref:hypothetical protein n=1 Tax=Kitasatospora purpeofusca TaxID=67352 RepID=UPI0036C5472C